jgi:sugar phosphate permease
MDGQDPERTDGGIPPRYRSRQIRHTLAWAFYGVFVSLIWNLAPFVIRERGGTALQSVLVNAGRAVPLLLALGWVPFAESRNPARLTGLFLGLGGAVLLFSGLADGNWALAMVLFFGSVLSSASQPLLGKTMQQVYPAGLRGKLMSLPNTVSMLVQVACLITVGRWLRGNVSGYALAFPLAGASLLVCAVFFRSIHGSRGGEHEGGIHPVRRLVENLRSTFRNRMLFLFLVGYFLATSGAVFAFNIIPLFAKDELFLNSELYGLSRAGFMAVALLSFPMWGRFLDRFGAPVTMVVSWFCQALLFACLFFVDSYWPFFGLMSVRGFFQAGNILAFFPIVMHFTAAEETGRGMSMHYLFWGIRWLFMTLLAAVVVDHQLMPMRATFLVTTVSVLTGVSVMAAVWRNDDGESAEDGG